MAAGDDSSVNTGATGLPIDTRLTASGDHRQVMVLGNAGDRVVGVGPRGALNVNLGPNTLFTDQWGTTLDTTDRWTVINNAPTFSGGYMMMSAAPSTYNALRSKPLMPYTLGFQYAANGIRLEATAAAGAGRFWGVGVQATTPAPGVLVQDGIGFEIDQATGNLLAVTYAAGARTTVATLTRPADGATHRYAVHYRVTDAYWYIDGLENPVASVNFPNVQVQELPVLIVRQNAASFTGTPVFDNIAVAVGDTSRMGQQIQDGALPWRKATVDAGGALVTKQATSTAAVTSVAAAITSTTVVAANTSRRALILHAAPGSSACYVRLGSAAATTALGGHTFDIYPGGYYEAPAGYTGAVTAIWSATGGGLNVTELS